jgi:nitroreductase
MNDYGISKLDLDQILINTLFTPTSFNLQHWRVVVIDNEQMIAQICKSALNWDQAFNPNKIVVLCGKNDSWMEAGKFSSHCDEAMKTGSIHKANMVYSENPRVQRDELFRSCGLAAASIFKQVSDFPFGIKRLFVLDEKEIKDYIKCDHQLELSLVFALDSILSGDNTQQFDVSDVLITNTFGDQK